MDFLDLINPSPDYYFTGYYYSRKPKPSEAPELNREIFHYKQINPYSRTFGVIMGTVRLDEETYAIKTHDDCNFKVKGYISTQDGKMWIIDQILHDEQVPGTEEALRIFKKPVQSEYLMRLLRVDNPWEVET